MLRRQGADRLVLVGDVCGMHTDLEETVGLLDDAGVVGVWGNHDFGLCGTTRPTRTGSATASGS